MSSILGGSYKEIISTYKQLGPEHGYEAHHIFAYASYKNVLEFRKQDGPSIRMSEEDHAKTASYDFKKNSQDYRNEQSQLLEQGRFGEAWYKDVNDIRTKFGDKYDQHLAQAEEQLLKLDQENKIKLEEKFKEEIKERQTIREALEQKQKEFENEAAKNELTQKQEQVAKEKTDKDLQREKEIKNEIEQYKQQLKENYDKAQAEYQQQQQQKTQEKKEPDLASENTNNSTQKKDSVWSNITKDEQAPSSTVPKQENKDLVWSNATEKPAVEVSVSNNSSVPSQTSSMPIQQHEHER